MTQNIHKADDRKAVSCSPIGKSNAIKSKNFFISEIIATNGMATTHGEKDGFAAAVQEKNHFEMAYADADIGIRCRILSPGGVNIPR